MFQYKRRAYLYWSTFSQTKAIPMYSTASIPYPFVFITQDFGESNCIVAPKQEPCIDLIGAAKVLGIELSMGRYSTTENGRRLRDKNFSKLLAATVNQQDFEKYFPLPTNAEMKTSDSVKKFLSGEIDLIGPVEIAVKELRTLIKLPLIKDTALEANLLAALCKMYFTA